MSNNVNIIEWEEIDEISINIVEKVKRENYCPDMIISIVRGGMIPSAILSHKLNIRDVENVVIKETIDDSINSEKLIPKIEENTNLKKIKNKKVLIVDDIVGSGETIRKLKQEIQKYNPQEIKTAIYFVNKINWNKSNNNQYCSVVDYIGREVEGWVVFPWENKQ